MAFHSVFLVFLAGLAFCSEAAPLEPLDTKEPLFVKVVDAVRGSPAANVTVKLYKEIADGVWKVLNSKQTNDKGGLPEFVSKEQFSPGSYNLQLDTATYWRSLGLNPFHHRVEVMFPANDAGLRNYKIVVIITPFSYSTTAVVSEPLA